MVPQACNGFSLHADSRCVRRDTRSPRKVLKSSSWASQILPEFSKAYDDVHFREVLGQPRPPQIGGKSESRDPAREGGPSPPRRHSHSPVKRFQDTRTGAGCTWRSISEILPERLVTSRSKKFWRFSQNSAFVLKYRARRSAVSAVIRRRWCTISPMRVAGTCSSSASLLTLRPSGFIKSSRRTST